MTAFDQRSIDLDADGGTPADFPLHEPIVLVGNAQHDAARVSIGQALGHTPRTFRADDPIDHIIELSRHGKSPLASTQRLTAGRAFRCSELHSF
jgi:hypothetical protein